MMRELRAPRRPVVRDVVAPEVQLVPDALASEQPREAARALERAGRVLPLPLPAAEEEADTGAQPVEVVAVEVRHVVHRVVEVRRVAPLPAASHDRDVVDTAEAESEREQVGSLESEVGRMKGAE